MGSVEKFFAENEVPVTVECLASKLGKTVEEIRPELENGFENGTLKKREFPKEDGNTEIIVWSNRQIPFPNPQPVVTSPFGDTYNHSLVLERLTDDQLSQEKLWLQTKLRKINTELQSLQARSKINLSEETEQELDNLTKQWKTGCQDMLTDLLKLVKVSSPETKMLDLLRGLGIKPKMVGWNQEEEDFD